MTIGRENRLVKGMKLSSTQIDRLVRSILKELKEQNAIETFKVPEEKVFKKAVEVILENIEEERQLERDTHKMLDDLEKKSPGGFERHKMFLMLKKRLAEERKFVL